MADAKINRRFRDTVLLAVWAYSYAILLRIFGIIKRIEPDSNRRGSQAAPS